MIEIGGDYFRRRGVDLYKEVRALLPQDYRAYLPVPAEGITFGDRFAFLREVHSFQVDRINNAFLIPDEKRQIVTRIVPMQ
jgi:hypothetical protein